jgi:hypothetical protein
MTDTISESAPHSSVHVMMGRRTPWTRIGLTLLLLVGLTVLQGIYYRRAFVPVTGRTATDMAQVARNIANGHGFVTNFVRPLNVTLKEGELTSVPELNSGPVYPYALSLLFRLKSPSDQVVDWTSLGFLSLTVIATFVLGAKLFDWKTGMVAAAALGLSAGALNAGLSGTAVTMTALEFTLLLIVVALHHQASAEGRRKAAIAWAALSGLLVAALYATNYIYAFAIVPVILYFVVTRPFGKWSTIVFLLAAIVLMAPLAYRNAQQTGFPVLGIRAWDLMVDTQKFPADTLIRSTDPTHRSPICPLMFPVENFPSFAQKLVDGCVKNLSALPSVLGLAALSAALVSVLYRFKKPAANAVRGLMYFMGPVMIAVFALYCESVDSVLIFAPVMTVFAANYFLLLVEAKRLHPFFGRALVAGFLLITAMQSAVTLVWRATDDPNKHPAAANKFFTEAGSRGARALVYTDMPWMAAWRTTSPAVWLPIKDEDVQALESKGLRMHFIVLTPESANYSPDETWWMIHSVRLWRDYIQDPQRGLQEILTAMNKKAQDVPWAGQSLQRLKRRYPVSTTISGYVSKPQDPMSPDDIQVLMHPDIAESQ